MSNHKGYKSKSDRTRQRESRRSRRAERSRSWRLFVQDVRINVQNSTYRSRLTAFSKLLLLIFIMAGIPILLLVLGKDSLLSTEFYANLPQTLSAHRRIAFVALVLLQMLQIVICVIPGQPIQFASSYLYGIGKGYLISILGAVIGSIITYYLARFLGSESLHLLFGEQRVKDYVHKLNSRRAYTIILLIYLIPGIPKDLVSYVAGISSINIKPFLLISTLGRTPGLIGSLLLGIFWADRNYLGLLAVAAVSILILVICYRQRARIMQWLSAYEDKDA